MRTNNITGQKCIPCTRKPLQRSGVECDAVRSLPSLIYSCYPRIFSFGENRKSIVISEKEEEEKKKNKIRIKISQAQISIPQFPFYLVAQPQRVIYFIHMEG